MKLSINWLTQYLKHNQKINNFPEDELNIIFDKLTMAGIEIEDIEVVDADKIVELKITPNRGDVLSVLGVLREIKALHIDSPAINYEVLLPTNFPNDFEEQIKATITDKIDLNVTVPDACSNYQALIIKNVNNSVTLPIEMTQRLINSGSKSISPIVDITNYVMLELGQPLHAFSLDAIGNQLTVRFAKENDTSFKLLADAKEVKLSTDTLLICDENDKPVAIAGVMGGWDSQIIAKHHNCNIVLESAFFSPDVIIAKAKHYGLSSEAAYRFERGVDPVLANTALKYAAYLIKKYCGGDTVQIGQISSKASNSLPKPISLTYQAINNLIGAKLEKSKIDDILCRLGFIIDSNTNETTLIVTKPSYRFDISIKEDIIEEVARIYGYDKIEAQIPISKYTMRDVANDTQLVLKTKLVNLGYSEIIAYAFLEDKFELLLGNKEVYTDTIPVRLQNPIANLNVMRTSLIADLIKTLQHNLNYGYKRMRIFELARVFHGETEDKQPLKLSGLIYGDYLEPNPITAVRSVDFYDLRNDIEVILSGLDDIKFISCDNHPIFHSGRCAKICHSERVVGILGQLHPKYKSEFNLPSLPYIFELDIDFIDNQKYVMNVQNVSKFQKVERDLAFLIATQINVGNVLELILSKNIPYLVKANIFDIYQGEKLANIKLGDSSVKSVAINFLFQGNKTLSEEEINFSMSMIQECIQAIFTIQLRN